MIKTRILKESNYKAVWFNGKTIRMPLDTSKPITELEYPEFYDMKITSYCRGACPWCYMDSTENDKHARDILTKTIDFFGNMSENQRPFQVAIGGGEPTEHPHFLALLSVLDSLGIEPNYTTNGMNVTNELLNATEKYCGGVAVSCHPHLRKHWEQAACKLSTVTHTNFHIIISDRKSIDMAMQIMDDFCEIITHFVLLPYGNQGRASPASIDWDYLVSMLPEDQSKIAYGANFYPYLQQCVDKIPISLYEPEIMSKFLDMSDMSIHKSSFNLNEIQT